MVTVAVCFVSDCDPILARLIGIVNALFVFGPNFALAIYRALALSFMLLNCDFVVWHMPNRLA